MYIPNCLELLVEVALLKSYVPTPIDVTSVAEMDGEKVRRIRHNEMNRIPMRGEKNFCIVMA